MHPLRQLHPGPGSQCDLPVDPGGLASSVQLRCLAHADQRVAPAPQHEFLQVPDRGQGTILRRLCRRRRTFPSCRRQSMASQEKVPSCGPFTIGV